MSALPAAIDGLVAALRERMPSGVDVVDGPPTTKVFGDLVSVGITPADPTEVESAATIAGLRVEHEGFFVMGLVRSWTGNETIKPSRDRCYELLALVKAAVDGDQTLGGAVTRARLTGSTYAPWRNERGQLVVDVVFRVDVDVL